jgi:RimJ/RimL family protein N-acetyltransferase
MTSPPGSATDYWPLARLRLTVEPPVGPLELRLPDAADLVALAALAEAGVHDPQTQPFGFPWTDAAPAVRALSTMQYHWASWGAWSPQRWELNLVAVRDGVVVGTQGISGQDFAVLRQVGTGSWIGKPYHGQGIGTAMRAAVLALAFDGLGAEHAMSAAFTDNAASLGVSHKLGYADDGLKRQLRRGEAAEMRRLRLDRESWLAHRTAEVRIDGLDPCLPLFGLPER